MLAAFFGAKLVSGIETILREICFEEKAKDADLIITGEGRLDSQTFSGKKAVAGVCAHAEKTPVVIVCGSAEYDAKTQDMPVMCTECAPIDEPLTREDAAERLYHAMRRVIAIRGAARCAAKTTAYCLIIISFGTNPIASSEHRSYLTPFFSPLKP